MFLNFDFKYCQAARFSGACPLVSCRLGRRAGNFGVLQEGISHFPPPLIFFPPPLRPRPFSPRSRRLSLLGRSVVMMFVFVVAGIYFVSLLAWRCGHGFANTYKNPTTSAWCR